MASEFDEKGLEVPSALRIDPSFAEFLKEVKEAQDELGEVGDLDSDEVAVILEALNKRWDTYDWCGDMVEITGKLRLANGHDTHSLCVKGVIEEDTLQIDEKGAYTQVAGMHLVCAGFDVQIETGDNGELTSIPKIGLTFNTRDQYEVDKEADELTMDGCLIIFPEDIEQIEFESASEEALEAYISYHHPDVFKHINDFVPRGLIGNKRLLAILNNFKLDIKGAVDKDPELLAKLSRYLVYRFGFGNDMYELSIKGDIETYDANGVRISSFTDGKPTVARAYIADLQVVEDYTGEGTYQLELWLGEPQRDVGGDLEILIVRGVDVETIRNLQNVTRRYGAVALKQFRDIGEINDFHRSLKESDESVSSHSHEPMDASVAEELERMNVFDPKTKSWFEKLLRYDEAMDRYVVDISDDIAAAEAVYNRILKRLKIRGPISTEDTDDFQSVYSELLEADIDLQTLKIGDLVRAHGPAVITIIKNLKTNESGAYKMGADSSMIGTFQGFILAPFPDMISNITDGAAGGKEYQLAALLSDPVPTTGKEWDHEAALLIPITGDESATFTLLAEAPDYTDIAAEESD